MTNRLFFQVVMVLAAVLFSAVTFSAELSDLTPAQQQTFKDGVFLTALNVKGAPPSVAQDLLADVFIALPNPPYEKLWQAARVLDNSASAPCGTNSGTDLEIDSCSISDVNSIIAGSFALLAESKFPDADTGS